MTVRDTLSRMDPANEIVAREEVPSEGTLLFTVHENGSAVDDCGEGVDEGNGEVAKTDSAVEGADGDVAAADGSTVEGILFELADGVVAFENYCQHWRDVRLDTGDGASMRDGEIVCEKHGAYFEADSGYCNFGPCEGAVLEEITVSVEDGTVYLADDRYSNPRLGGAAGESDPSGNRIGFTGN